MSETSKPSKHAKVGGVPTELDPIAVGEDPTAPWGRDRRGKAKGPPRTQRMGSDGRIAKVKPPKKGQILKNGIPYDPRDPEHRLSAAIECGNKWLPLTAKRKVEFALLYSKTGRVQQTCDELRIERTAYSRERSIDPSFHQLCLDAELRFRETLEAEVVRRGRDGWDEPLVGGKFRDEIIAYVRKFDSNLLLAELKKRDPNYREKTQQEIVSTQTVLNVNVSLDTMPREARDALRRAAALITPSDTEPTESIGAIDVTAVENPTE